MCESVWVFPKELLTSNITDNLKIQNTGLIYFSPLDIFSFTTECTIYHSELLPQNEKKNTHFAFRFPSSLTELLELNNKVILFLMLKWSLCLSTKTSRNLFLYLSFILLHLLFNFICVLHSSKIKRSQKITFKTCAQTLNCVCAHVHLRMLARICVCVSCHFQNNGFLSIVIILQKQHNLTTDNTQHNFHLAVSMSQRNECSLPKFSSFAEVP